MNWFKLISFIFLFLSYHVHSQSFEPSNLPYAKHIVREDVDTLLISNLNYSHIISDDSIRSIYIRNFHLNEYLNAKRNKASMLTLNNKFLKYKPISSSPFKFFVSEPIQVNIISFAFFSKEIMFNFNSKEIPLYSDYIMDSKTKIKVLADFGQEFASPYTCITSGSNRNFLLNKIQTKDTFLYVTLYYTLTNSIDKNKDEYLMRGKILWINLWNSKEKTICLGYIKSKTENEKEKEIEFSSSPDIPSFENEIFNAEYVNEYPQYNVDSFLEKNLNYPENIELNFQKETIIVNFIVERDGSTSNIEVKKSIYPELDAEAKRVISLIKWRPAIKDGQKVRCRMSTPITFSSE